MILVAHAAGKPLGTIALRPYLADDPMPETPWVRQLYVFPAHRGRGVDRALIRVIEQAAVYLGYRMLHAATNRIEPLLVHRGWHVFQRMQHEGEAVALLRKPLQPFSK